jgi:hypothetical protein
VAQAPAVALLLAGRVYHVSLVAAAMAAATVLTTLQAAALAALVFFARARGVTWRAARRAATWFRV